jgi:hypothetical protein
MTECLARRLGKGARLDLAETTAHAERHRTLAALSGAGGMPDATEATRQAATAASLRDQLNTDLRRSLSAIPGTPPADEVPTAPHPEPTRSQAPELIADQTPITIDGQRWRTALERLDGIEPVLMRVLTDLNLRVYPGDARRGDRSAYVVLDVHGVSIALQRRCFDLYAHVDTSESGDRLISFEVNGTGEVSHPAQPGPHAHPISHHGGIR